MSQGGKPATRTFAHYELQALVGRGGMAEVFRAVDLAGPRAGHKVAIKRLLPELAQQPQYVEMFVGEADLSRMLHHPNIIEVYEAGTVGEQYYMVMEYIDGRDLGQILKRCRERKILLPVDFAVFLGVVLLEALAYAHSARGPSGKPLGIVHCDISPSNLFISRVGEIKLGDFGIAKAHARDGLEGVTPVWGKAYYLSPEALAGHTDQAADLWAATVTLYELLCNERPFTGADPDQVCRAIRLARPTSLFERRLDVSSELDGVIMRGFARDPSERYRDAARFAEALRPHFDDLIGNPMAIAAVVRGLFGA
ncbi:MAG TPA: serine/threonine protein kinase [Myxococcales bacterium]|nr:serine/threonine protein kinase [Myxococcales bacterium]